tara:strand:+ start:4543 stop:5001 length:459 start_codon:yes stop_codon:yes gene_type:complete
MNRRVLSSQGSGLIEVVVASALLLTVFVGLFTVLQLSTKLATDNKAHTGATALAVERMEYIRSLDYSVVGVVGGDPQGVLEATENITLNTVAYTRDTTIVYVDDEKDGLGGSDVNGISNDYKRVKVEVSWQSPSGTRSSTIVSDIAGLQIEQ